MMNIKENLKHWTKVDHITFLLILPAIMLEYKYVAIALWIIALIYDLWEGYSGKEK